MEAWSKESSLIAAAWSKEASCAPAWAKRASDGRAWAKSANVVSSAVEGAAAAAPAAPGFFSNLVSRAGKGIRDAARQSTQEMVGAKKLVERAVPAGGTRGRQGYDLAENTGVSDWLAHRGNQLARRAGAFMENDPHIAMGLGAAGTGLAAYGAYRGVSG